MLLTSHLTARSLIPDQPRWHLQALSSKARLTEPNTPELVSTIQIRKAPTTVAIPRAIDTKKPNLECRPDIDGSKLEPYLLYRLLGTLILLQCCHWFLLQPRCPPWSLDYAQYCVRVTVLSRTLRSEQIPHPLCLVPWRGPRRRWF